MYFLQYVVMDKQTQTDLEASIAKLEKENQRLDEEISRTNEEISRLDEEISRTNEEISRKDEEISRKDEEISRKDEEISMLDKEILRLKEGIEKIDTLWNMALEQRGRSSPSSSSSAQSTRLSHIHEMLDHILSDEKSMKVLIMSTKEVFDDTLEDLSHIIKKSGDSQHFQDYQDITVESTDQYTLYTRHFLLMTQIRKAQSMNKELLWIFFGPEQSMIYDYIKLANKYDNELYTVTPHNMTKYISMIKSEEEFKEILPGRDGGEITIDGTIVKTIRPDDEDEQRDTLYSGNDKMPIIRTAMILNRQKYIIAISDSQEVRYDDPTWQTQGLPNFGKWTQRLTEGKRIPSDRRVRLNLDGGYVGIQNYLLGVNTKIPYNTPEDKEITSSTKNTQNKAHTKRCIPAEKVFEHVKNWKSLPGRYDGTAKEFNVEFNGTCGMYNKQKMWHDGTYQYWKNKIKNRI